MLFIIKNIPDSNNVEEDSKFIKSRLSKSNEEISLNNIKIFRLGKYNQQLHRPRLLKVRLENASHAQWLIYNFKSLHINDEIICRSDKTPYQRSQLNSVLSQLKQRTNNGEKYLIIKYINNIPTIISSVKTVITNTPTNSNAGHKKFLSK